MKTFKYAFQKSGGWRLYEKLLAMNKKTRKRRMQRKRAKNKGLD